ncbi:hypothetical protein G5B38_16825 [Pseudohalocynthiibacter aestuariivivens]|uniref:Stress-induced acidophilic repeat motif-containing protein n=1 Tax=Roseovarius pelagicus TaxID=2980108 RepID=A0ABY6DKU2_9RHOB|nr:MULTISPECIES: hypothetical protein [Rhodobacterales]QIE47055.1 hypothetical protein G5B38_16825 [Pseudohalocynthiibacter aestuariivivens]UXX84395.1 hypothetical protein N7U68_07075 [Roseovarius pelagicus]
MADRQRSKDGKRETETIVQDEKTPTQQGRAGGNLERDVGTRAALNRAKGDRPGVTRVRKSDEKGQGNLGGHHGTGEED